MLPLLVAVACAESAVAFFLASKVPPLVKLGQSVVDVLRCNKGARVLVKTVTGAFVVRLASDLSSTLKLQRRGAAVADQLVARSQLLEITLICKLFFAFKLHFSCHGKGVISVRSSQRCLVDEYFDRVYAVCT